MELEALQIQQRVTNELSGTVVGGLTPAVHAEHRNPAPVQDMLRVSPHS
jgi:hypothetical protein